jgi:hypothetical protein
MAVIPAWVADAVIGLRRRLREQKLIRCARVLRKYSVDRRRLEPNIHCFPRTELYYAIKEHNCDLDDLLEFMEAKGWAQKVRHPPDCFWIN